MIWIINVDDLDNIWIIDVDNMVATNTTECPIIDSTIKCDNVCGINNVTIDKKPDWIFIIALIIVIILGYLIIKGGN